MTFRDFRYWLPLICLLIMSCNGPGKGKTILSRFITNTIIVGSWQNDWSQADSIRMEDAKVSDNKVVIKSLWDNDSLYFRFQVADKDLRAIQTEKDHPKLYLDDMVEILIDANNDKSSCWSTDDIIYHINILGTKKDDRGTADCQSDPTWDGVARYAVKLNGTLDDTTDIDTGYIVEMAIPWTELGLRPKPGLAIGINFANGDNDGNGRQLFNWSGAFPMRSPHAFGTLILTGTKLPK